MGKRPEISLHAEGEARVLSAKRELDLDRRLFTKKDRPGTDASGQGLGLLASEETKLLFTHVTAIPAIRLRISQIMLASDGHADLHFITLETPCNS